MWNMIVADTQRIFRGWAIYVTLAIILGLTATHAFGVANAFESYGLTANGSTMPFHLMLLNENILIGVIFITSVAFEDFTTGTAKNVLTNGVPRIQYFLAKLFLTWIFAALVMVAHVFGGTLLATIANGFGGTIDGEWLLSVFIPFAIILFQVFAISTVGVALAFIIQKNSAQWWHFGIIMAPIFLSQILMDISEHFRFLSYIDLLTILRQAVFIDYLSTADITRILLIGFGYLAVSLVAGIAYFRKCEVR